MKLCAQLYSVREAAQTPEGIRDTFHKIKAIGYEAVQVSGLGKIDAGELRDISEETGLPITCTHSPFDRILHDTDALIAEHKIYHCPVIGLGSMPNEYKGSEEALKRLFTDLEKPVGTILDAGLHFAYHNHNFEFAALPEGGNAFDRMLEACPDWHFILDTYWVEYAGYSAVDYIRKVGGKRLPNIHYKDMARDEKRSICACGDGILDFSAITAVCREIGVQNALVEQDNAASFPDMFEQMERSFRALRPIVK